MARRPTRPKLTLAMQEFICEQIASGMFLTEVCRKHADKLPSVSTIHAYGRKNPEFRANLAQAYIPLFLMKIDEYDTLSKRLLKSGEEDRWAIKRIEVRMKSLEYQIKVVAPILTEAFTGKQSIEVEHKGTVNTGVTIVDYSKADVEAALLKAKKIMEKKVH